MLRKALERIADCAARWPLVVVEGGKSGELEHSVQQSAMRQLNGPFTERGRRTVWLPTAICAVLVVAGCAAPRPAPVIDRSTAPATTTAPPRPAAAQPVVPAPAAAPPAGVTATPPTVLPIPAHGTHLVQRGETLYRIALTYGLDMHALAAWNGMSVNQTLREGQLLRLTPPPAGLVQTAPAAPAPAPLIGQPLPAPAPAPPPAAAPAPSQAPPAVLEPSPPSMARPVEPPTRREPRALRLPYSDSALAEMQREARAQSVEPSSAVSTAPATPASAPSARSETTAGQGPEVRPGPVFERDGIRWTWPTTGRVVTAFNERAPLKGIEIAAPVGTAVVAAATGKVIFIGNELRGCGQMIVISHGEGVVSIYCHVGKVSVREQQRVTLGQKIAEVSDTHNGRLHFEVRKQGRPLDPVALMPR